MKARFRKFLCLIGYHEWTWKLAGELERQRWEHDYQKAQEDAFHQNEI